VRTGERHPRKRPPDRPATAREHHPLVVFRTLGDISLCRLEGDQLQSVFVQSKQLALLSYLCCGHRFVDVGRGVRSLGIRTSQYAHHRRDLLVALFWPECDDAHAHGALRQALHGLRGDALGEHVLITRGKTEVALNHETFWCDASEFAESIEQGDVEHAVSLYSGGFLTGFHTTGVPEFTRWMETARDRLERAYATGLEQLAEEAEQRGDRLSAAEWWRRLSEHDPYNSRIVIRTMEALDASGARCDALRLAKNHEILLRRTFGIDLDPQVRATTDRLRSHSRFD
jgi:DNA-binding SARP family transcriptional activator